MQRHLVLAGLLWLPALPLSAERPFDIGGLHVHRGFEDAVLHAESLGGACELGSLKRGAVLTALCEYAVCDGEGSDVSCAGSAQATEPFAVVGQPVLSIAIEANAGAARLTRIAFIYEGDSQVVKESLLNTFGPPVSDESDYAEQTWTHGRRMQWRSGEDGMGLLMTAKVITLSSTAPGLESGTEAAPPTPDQKQPGGS